MAMMAALVIVLLAAALPRAATDSFPIADVRNCPTTQPRNPSAPLYRLTALPGTGFDNLRNLDMGEVFFFNYSTCKESNDGKYLLPDSVVLYPIFESTTDMYSELFDHWDDYTSMTSSSINLAADFSSSISGKFSAEYGLVKSNQVNNNAKTIRAQIKNRLYTAKLQPDSQLHPAFRSRLVAIANSLLNNDTATADYLSELLVRDYGTHYVTSLELGGVLSLIDHLDSNYVQSISNSQDNLHAYSSLTATAVAELFSMLSFSAGISYTSGTSSLSVYQQNRRSSQLITKGGPQYRSNFTLQYWQDGVPNALVATDRLGNPLHFCITPSALPDLPPMSILQTADSVYNAISRYYKVNTRYGCTDPGSKGFNLQANVDDGSCGKQTSNFTFGGLFQTCVSEDDSCSGSPIEQTNPLTGSYSCPSGYTQVQLRSGVITRTRYVTVCHQVCSSCGFLYLDNCCECQSVGSTVLSTLYYTTYWCAALGPYPPSSGYLFGGVYTSTSPNPVTGSSKCPTYFNPLKMGQDISVCVSSDFELGAAYSLPFAGFDSCEMGNPLAATTDASGVPGSPSSWPNHCPQGYSQHLITIDNSCEINYCLQSGALNGAGLVPVRLPPFSQLPQQRVNATQTMVVGGLGGVVWVRRQDGTWSKRVVGGADGASVLEQPSDPTKYSNGNSTSVSSGPTQNPYTNSSPQSVTPQGVTPGSSGKMLEGVEDGVSAQTASNGLSSGAIAGASVASIVGAGLVALVLLLFGKLVWHKYGKLQAERGKLHTRVIQDDAATPYSHLVVNENRAEDHTNAA